MRKYLATSLFALSLAVSGAAFAQDAQTAAPAQDSSATAATTNQQGDRMLDNLAQKLNLSEDQKQQLKPIFAERRQKMQELKASTEAKRDKHKDAKQIMQDSDGKVKGVLTADQFTQYQQLRQQMREHRKDKQNQMQQP